MAEILHEAALVKTLCWLQEPKQLPERCDFSYAQALAPCCSDDLLSACRAADHALITLKAAVARDKRERGDAAAALAAAASAVAAWRRRVPRRARRRRRQALPPRRPRDRVLDDGVPGPLLAHGPRDARVRRRAAPRGGATRAAASARHVPRDGGLGLSAGAARTLAGGALKLGDLAADGGPLVRASAALREAAGCWAASPGRALRALRPAARARGGRRRGAQVGVPRRRGPARRGQGARARARGGRETRGRRARLADGAAAAEGAAVAAVEPQDRQMAANLAAASLAGFAVGDLLRARVAAAAERPGDAVAFAARAERRFAALRDAGTKGGWGGHDHAAYPDLTEATRSAYALAGGALGSAKAPGLDAVAARAHEAYDRDNRTIYFASVPATLLFDPERFAAVAAARREAEDIQRVADDAARAEARARADAEAAAAAEEEKKRLAAEQASFLEVTCPTGFGPGDALWVRGPDGTQDADHVGVYGQASAGRAAAGGAAGRARAAADRAAARAAGRRGRGLWTCPSAPSTAGSAAACAICAGARGGPGADADAALARRLAAENAAPPPSEADDVRVAQQLRIQLDEERRQQEARDEAFARSLAQQGPSAPPNPF
ncbi:hypothetical protein JL720_15418 [Aureococcus anophagefferens]|nr:hypothetical protein JL720_15418 [Aureococcus anophagefferens]